MKARELRWGGVSLLSLAGLGLATYLAAVYFSGTSLSCGSLGGCESVTTSEYARFLGIPVTVLGVAVYSSLLLGSLAVIALEHPPPVLKWGLLAVAGAGVAFTIYLTAIELFVLHAVCVYCVASAILITAILVLIAVAMRLERSVNSEVANNSRT